MSSKYADKGEARRPAENSPHNVKEKNEVADRMDDSETVQQPRENNDSKV